jgi:hypothetical protein
MGLNIALIMASMTNAMTKSPNIGIYAHHPVGYIAGVGPLKLDGTPNPINRDIMKVVAARMLTGVIK